MPDYPGVCFLCNAYLSRPGQLCDSCRVDQYAGKDFTKKTPSPETTKDKEPTDVGRTD